MTKTIKLRPHHLLCLQGFQGYGYNSKFVQRIREILKKLKLKNQIIQVITTSDDICSACPYQVNNTCQKGDYSEKRVKSMDLKVLRKLGLRDGQKVINAEIQNRLSTKLNSFLTVVKICGTCGWREVCKFYTYLRRDWQTTKARSFRRRYV